jgi:hypothetical protein
MIMHGMHSELRGRFFEFLPQGGLWLISTDNSHRRDNV